LYGKACFAKSTITINYWAATYYVQRVRQSSDLARAAGKEFGLINFFGGPERIH
jgi:hypothetical protein